MERKVIPVKIVGFSCGFNNGQDDNFRPEDENRLKQVLERYVSDTNISMICVAPNSRARTFASAALNSLEQFEDIGLTEIYQNIWLDYPFCGTVSKEILPDMEKDAVASAERRRARQTCVIDWDFTCPSWYGMAMHGLREGLQTLAKQLVLLPLDPADKQIATALLFSHSALVEFCSLYPDWFPILREFDCIQYYVQALMENGVIKNLDLIETKFLDRGF